MFSSALGGRKAADDKLENLIGGKHLRVVVEAPSDPTAKIQALDSVESVSVAVLVERIGRLSDERIRELCTAFGVAVDCD